MNTNYNRNFKSTLKTSYIAPNGESLEEQIRKAMSTNSPVEAISPIIYTERADGIHPEMDIRTDRQEVALEAADKLSRHYAAVRADSIADRLKGTTTDPNNNKTE